MQFTAQPRTTTTVSATAPSIYNHVAYIRILTALLFLAAIALTVMLNARPAHAEEICASRGCALACNSRQKVCSLFPTKSVPAGYVKVTYMPFGFRRVRQSACDKLVCPTNSTTCRRWIPTGKDDNAKP